MGRAAYDPPEVHHHAAVGQRVHGRRRHRVLLGPGPLGVEGGEGCRAGRPEDRGRRPLPVVVAGLGPAERRRPAVDDLHEVVALGVAGRGRLPLGGPLPPGAVGAEHLAGAVLVVDRELQQGAGDRRGPPVAGPVPVVQQAHGVRPAGPDLPGQVGGLVVGLVRVGEARPGGHHAAVGPELVLVGGGHVRRGPHDRAGPGVDDRAEVGVLLGHGPGRPGAQPARRPVGRPQAGHERPGGGPGALGAGGV